MTLCFDLRFHFDFSSDLTCHPIFTIIFPIFHFLCASIKPFYGPFGIIYNFYFHRRVLWWILDWCFCYSNLCVFTTSEIHLAYWTVCVRKPFHKIYIRLAYQKESRKKIGMLKQLRLWCLERTQWNGSHALDLLFPFLGLATKLCSSN